MTLALNPLNNKPRFYWILSKTTFVVAIGVRWVFSQLLCTRSAIAMSSYLAVAYGFAALFLEMGKRFTKKNRLGRLSHVIVSLTCPFVLFASSTSLNCWDKVAVPLVASLFAAANRSLLACVNQTTLTHPRSLCLIQIIAFLNGAACHKDYADAFANAVLCCAVVFLVACIICQREIALESESVESVEQAVMERQHSGGSDFTDVFADIPPSKESLQISIGSILTSYTEDEHSDIAATEQSVKAAFRPRHSMATAPDEDYLRELGGKTSLTASSEAGILDVVMRVHRRHETLVVFHNSRVEYPSWRGHRSGVYMKSIEMFLSFDCVKGLVINGCGVRTEGDSVVVDIVTGPETWTTHLSVDI